MSLHLQLQKRVILFTFKHRHLKTWCHRKGFTDSESVRTKHLLLPLSADVGLTSLSWSGFKLNSSLGCCWLVHCDTTSVCVFFIIKHLSPRRSYRWRTDLCSSSGVVGEPEVSSCVVETTVVDAAETGLEPPPPAASVEPHQEGAAGV